MKLALFIFCWTILASYTQAQILWTNPQTMSSVYNQQEIIHTNSKGFLSLYRYKDKQYIFQQRLDYYNNQLELEKSRLLDTCDNSSKKETLLGFFELNKTLYSYFLNTNLEESKEQFFVHSLDSKKPPVLLFDIGDNYHQSYKISSSPNQSKLLIYYQLATDKKENAKLHLLVFDDNFNLLTDKKINLSQKSNSFDINDISEAIIKDDGAAVLLYKRYKHQEKREEKKQGPLFVFSLINLSKDGIISSLDTLQIQTPKDSAVLISATLFLDASTQDIHCIGTFGGAKEHYALFDYNTTENNAEKAVIINYPASFVDSSVVSPRLSQKKKKMGLENYKIKQILPQQNGDKIILAEQVYSYVYFDKTEGRQETHRLNNIALIRISADTVQWVQSLAKRQKGGGVGYTNIPLKLYSFYAFQKEEKVVILYNDLESNLDIKEEMELKPIDWNNPKDGSLIACQIDLKDGTLLSKKSIYTLENSQHFFVPSSAKKMLDKSIYFIGFKPEKQAKNNATYHFGKIESSTF